MDFLKIPTPAYIYDLDLLEKTVDLAVREANNYGFRLHYAMKANNHPRILQVMKDHELGVDCVSGNELSRAIDQGFNPADIVFAGVGKTDEELLKAIRLGIFSINCESLEELDVIGQLSDQHQLTANVSLRVNPDIDGHTHAKITTGLRSNKFGISEEQLGKAISFCAAHPFVQLVGLHFHIGSQINAPEPFRQLAIKASNIWEMHRLSQLGATSLNLGGGLGINYQDPERFPFPDFKSFFHLMATHLRVPEGVEVRFEPGRSLVGQCGTLATRVLFVKKATDRQFVVVDAGMTELLRPSLYKASHKIVNPVSAKPAENYDIVGPLCESSDVFATDYPLPLTSRGDILLIQSCGAYAQSMSLRYNLRDSASEIFVHNHTPASCTLPQNEL